MLLDGIDHHPVFFDFPNMLGVALKRQDKFDESASWYERACELTARHPIFEAVRASALRLGGSTVEAEEIVRMLRDSGDDPRVDSIARALIAVAKHDLDAALRHFHEAADQRLPLIFWCLRAVLRDREFPAKDPGVQALWRRLWPHELEMAGGATSGDVAIPNEAGSREMSIVVLPFANLSPDPDTEYFSDGLTDEIITDLSRVRALRVISRSSAMRLKDDERGLAAVGRDLDCRYVLEGSVRRAANTLRITARLVDAPEDVQIWSDKYGGTLDDVFDIQERVSRSIVDALEIQLTPQEAEQLAERPIDDVRAQESYLRARSEIWSFMPGGLDLAVSHLQSALDLIGDNALIYQGLGETYFQYVNIGAAIGREEELIRKAEDCVDRIFTLEPESPRGYLVRAQTQMARGDIHGSVGSLRRVLQSFPNEIVALQLYTHALGWLGGKPDAATPVAARLVDVDPLNPMSLLVSAMVPLFAGRFSEGVDAARRMFDLDPVTPVWRSNFVMALSYARQFDEAEALTEGVAAEPDSDIATWQMGLCRAAWREDHAEIVRLADGPYQRVATWDAEVPWLLASAHAAVGARDEALHWLDLAIDQGMINYPFLSEHDWCLDGIRGDERFGGAMERARREWERLDEVLP
jgi:TolB-like protein/Flp pilus assembly protein TadD